MRLRIRAKLLLLLLAIALLPVGLVSWFDYRAMGALGLSLADQSRQALAERARNQLAQMAEDYAALIRRETQILELLIQRQAREAELRLADPPSSNVRAVFDREIDDGSAQITLMPSSRYLRRHPHDGEKAVPVTFDTQVFRVPVGTRPEEVSDDIARLATMTDVYREALDRHPDLVFWQYTALESGLHSVYPGHGGYPPSFDPRVRPWYVQQKQAQKLLWNPPHVDATTGQVTLSLSMPIRGSGGRFAGVTGIDVPITSILAVFPLPADWAADSRTFVLAPEERPPSGELGLRIIAKQSYETTGEGWDALIAPEWLTIEEPAVHARVIDDMRNRRAGIVQASFDGKQSLWAYREIRAPAAYLLMIVPYDRVVGVARGAYDVALSQTTAQLRTAVYVVLAVTAAILAIAFASARTITRPIQELAETTRRVAAGDFDARVQIATGDELQELGEVFNATVPQLKERLHFLESIALAKEVQQNLLPQNPPASENVDIAGSSVYCEATGGDYYDFLDLGHEVAGQIGVAVGDVSGHGVSSALLMTTVRALLHSFAKQSYPPSEIMKRINEQLVQDIHAGRFMTLFYLIIDSNGRSLRWTSSGHDPAILYRAASAQFIDLAGLDIPLGVESGWDFRPAQTTHWLPGDIVLLATDGAWEARNAAEEPFGKQRLRDILKVRAAEPAHVICDAVVSAVAAFRGERPQKDDITVVVVKARD